MCKTVERQAGDWSPLQRQAGDWSSLQPAVRQLPGGRAGHEKRYRYHLFVFVFVLVVVFMFVLLVFAVVVVVVVATQWGLQCRSLGARNLVRCL